MMPKPKKLDRPFFACYDYGFSPDLEKAQEMAVEMRSLDCTQYDACLDHAARQHWRGFSCEGCPLWRSV